MPGATEEKKETTAAAPAVDEKVLQDKLDKGETLTEAEEKYLLSEEPAAEGYKPGLTDEKEEPAAPEEKKPGEAAKPAEKKEETKPAEGAKPTPEDDAKDPFIKIERELSKPEGQEDLKDFTGREKAYYYQMRRDRKARQKAEEDRDAALFRENQLKSKVPEEKKPEPVDPLAELKKKDPTDFVAVADVLKIVESIVNKQPEPKKEDAPAAKSDPVRMGYLKMCEEKARVAHPEDYDAVMELTEDIMMTNEKYLIEVATAMNAGENPAIKSYELIKADPEFAKLFPAAEARVKGRAAAGKKPEEKKEDPKPAGKTQAEIDKEKKALAAQEAFEKNQNKTKTTGNLSSGTEAEDGEPSMEEIAKMSDKEFRKLPKKTRQKYLERMKDV